MEKYCPFFFNGGIHPTCLCEEEKCQLWNVVDRNCSFNTSKKSAQLDEAIHQGLKLFEKLERLIKAIEDIDTSQLR